jgi:hypothetical protein
MKRDIAFFTSLEMGSCDWFLPFRPLFCGATFILYHANHPNKMACCGRWRGVQTLCSTEYGGDLFLCLWVFRVNPPLEAFSSPAVLENAYM